MQDDPAEPAELAASGPMEKAILGRGAARGQRERSSGGGTALSGTVRIEYHSTMDMRSGQALTGDPADSLRIDILTLFPDMFRGPFDHSVIARARAAGYCFALPWAATAAIAASISAWSPR